jgi:RHH-type transcriptional regulator, proline utilization regulon repressor / proline dehydrogenase / delta 1-pyrroline-5-carboxylate dehydrogenase
MRISSTTVRHDEGDAAWENQKAALPARLRAQGQCVFRPAAHPEPRQRATQPLPGLAPFHNAADTDWALLHNVRWIREKVAAMRAAPSPVSLPLCHRRRRGTRRERSHRPRPVATWPRGLPHALAGPAQVERALPPRWTRAPLGRRSAMEGARNSSASAAAEIERDRGEAIATMVLDAGKAVSEADVEVTEAIDFANYYADSMRATAR